ncbi:hypothetical protein PUV54_07650 [Hyphococcus flavus]|uniref:Uncharacterized protein n=1 Tax=Hyphococcus flavus TaxID=1866326 RepID=A0AAE9ZDI8_9PROT|nr:hypothetical protein [Hyphococcus flavus]WDI33068.1 hypothetical protein PUV54_07650 [Hyphococcus flavus]
MLKAVAPSRLRSVRNVICVTFGIFAAHSCASTTAPSLTAQDLLVAPYTYAAGQPFDVDAFLAAFPSWLTTSYSAAEFDPEQGAMVIENFRFGFAAAPELGFLADRAVVWDADVDSMTAVFSGTANNTAKASLFDRIALEGLRSEGMQWDGGSESASISFDKLVIDGLAARSYNLAPKAGVGEESKILRNMAAVMGSFAYDGAAYSNFSLRLANSSGERVEVDVAEAFARGYDAGAVAFQSASGVTALIHSASDDVPVEVSEKVKGKRAEGPYAKILNLPPSEAMNEVLRRPTAMLAAAAVGETTAYEIDYTEARGADLSGALLWLARWELPPITETNLIDLGAQTMLGYRESWDGQLIQSIERTEIPAADFYWLVPAQYDVVYSGYTQEIGQMFGVMQNRMPPGFSTEAAPQFEEMFAVMNALGLERIAGDMDFSWRWNGETGDAAVSTSSDLIDLLTNDLGISVGGPTLAEWDVMARNDTPMAAAVTDISLQGFNFGLGDRGILDRAFAYAAEEQGMTGPDLRQSMSAMARLTGAQAGEMNPRIESYAGAVADFIAGGGRIDIVAAPETPVDFMTLQSVGQTAPQTLPDVLNLSITHTAE